MGLVGLHIAHMPALFGTWSGVWATFEHRLTVSPRINDGETRFSFNNELHADQDASRVRRVRPCEGRAGRVKCCPNAELYPGETSPSSDDLPSQVTRWTDPTVSTILPTQCNPTI
jgi:hypothetical protein